jgi:hypothetical protein
MELGLGFHASETLCAHVGAMENTDKIMINTARPRLAKTVPAIIYFMSFLITTRYHHSCSKGPGT